MPGADKVRLYDNQHVWDLRELPARLLVVGGGPNGAELGQAMQRLGSQVTIVQHGSRLLEQGLARDLGGDVELRFAEAGVQCEVWAPLAA